MSHGKSSKFLKVLKERKESIKPYHVGLYDLGETIGEGNFAKVKIGRHAVIGSKVAIKVIDKSKLTPTAAQKLVREVKIMKMLNHPHICRLYEVIETEEEMFLILEYAEGGELFDYLVAHGRMKEKDARKQFRQIVSAIDFCHKKNVIHRDLKAENLLLDLDKNIKIADFGFSNQFTSGQQLNTWCGSPPYAAPELFQGKEYEGPEIDIWSLGVVLYVLICGALPFDGNSLSVLKSRVLSGKFKIPFFMSSECEMLIKKMLIVDPQMRATIDEIKHDKWLNDGYPDLDDTDSLEITYSEENHKEILKRLESFGVDPRLVAKSLEGGGFDYIGGMYNLVADEVSSRKNTSLLFITSASPTVASIAEEPTSPRTPEPKTPDFETPVERRKSRARSNTVSTKPDLGEIKKETIKEEVNPQRASMFVTTPLPQLQQQQQMNELGQASPVSFDPFPKDKKKRRQRAMSLSTNDKPVTPPRPVSIVEGSGFSPYSSSSLQNSPSSPLPSTSNQTSPTRPSPQRLTGQSRATISVRYSAPSGRLTIKDFFKKTFGIKDENKEVKPRTLRFHFSVSTTSARDARELIEDLEKSLFERGVAFERENFLFLCRKDSIAFELEICKLPRLSLNGFRFKRLAGDQWEYKSLCTDVIEQLKL